MERFDYLFDRYISKTATPSERWEFQEMLRSEAYDEKLRQLLDYYFANFEPIEFGTSDPTAEQMLSAILNGQTTATGVEKPVTRIRKLWPRIAAAAAIILMIGAGIFYYNYKPTAEQQHQIVKNDIKPGSNKAYLTLVDGTRIALNDANNGMLAKQAGVTITKTADGQVVYSIGHGVHNLGTATQYNFIETPNGGQYQVKLPDGTAVWLNAASSLKYPASFASLKERKVELHGEAYFEVAKDRSHPFIVATDKQDVKVLGTHFNINSYADEPEIKTTLLEGSVQLNGKTILKPGEEASLSPSGTLNVTEVNVSKAVAWKNGKFVFTSESIESIMRKLARWYNVEVVYEGDFSDKRFTGSISRFDNISKILDKITFTQAVRFKIEGRRVTVMK